MLVWKRRFYLPRDKCGADMRAVYHCKTCDFRLPYCVRTDRRFCQERCRIWWYGHPGRKRPDFSPGAWGLPEHPGKGQPKTLEAALQALAEARKHAAELDAAARAIPEMGTITYRLVRRHGARLSASGERLAALLSELGAR